MSGFDKDDYLNDLPDARDLKASSASGAVGGGSGDHDVQEGRDASAGETSATAQEGDGVGDGDAQVDGANPDAADVAESADGTDREDSAQPADSQGTHAPDGDNGAQSREDSLTPLGKAKKEAAEYLDALQRERAEFINYRNRSAKEQQRFREHGIIDVLTALLPALDDVDRIREHGEMNDSFKAVATKIDKAFEKFGVEKFGEKGEDFDPARHDAVLHKQDPEASKETIDAVVEAGYRIGDRVIRAARVVVASPRN